MTEPKHLSDAEIEAYANALKSKTTDSMPVALQHHVADCLQCRKEAIFIFRTNLNMDEATEGASAKAIDPHETDGHATGMGGISVRVWYRIAASLVFVVGCGVLFWYYVHRAEGPDMHSESIRAAAFADSIHAAERSRRLLTLAQNSEPSANMEDLLTSNFRGESLRVLKPHPGDTLRLPYHFEWDNHSKNPLTLRLLTNKEEERIRVETRSGNYILPDTLTPGLYYWVIEGNGSLLHVGKVYVY